jgi:hypothetical protein
MGQTRERMTEVTADTSVTITKETTIGNDTTLHPIAFEYDTRWDARIV